MFDNLPDLVRTFTDTRGVTHEALNPIHNHRIGVVALCGKLQSPALVEDKTLKQLSMFAWPQAQEGVDCMTCLIARIRVDEISVPDEGPMIRMNQIDVSVSWK